MITNLKVILASIGTAALLASPAVAGTAGYSLRATGLLWVSHYGYGYFHSGTRFILTEAAVG